MDTDDCGNIFYIFIGDVIKIKVIFVITLISSFLQDNRKIVSQRLSIE